MGRKITLTPFSDTFTQSRVRDNVEIRLFTLGGNDKVSLNRVDDLGGGNLVDTGSGRDTVVNFKEYGNDIFLGSGDDTYIGRGFGAFRTDPFDQVFAGTGNDLIAVETFKSRYFGEAGDDRFFSVGWQNVFHGGDGVDSISYAPRGDDSVQGGTAVTINLAKGFAQTGANRRETLISIENATGSNEDDIIIGSRVNNRIDGAAGADDLTGGRGADHFVFAKVSHSPARNGEFDLIFDFSRREGDKIDLDLIDANTRIRGNQDFTFIGTDAFTGKAGQLRIKAGDDGVLVTGDVDGDRRADFAVGVFDVASLRGSDFIL